MLTAQVTITHATVAKSWAASQRTAVDARARRGIGAQSCSRPRLNRRGVILSWPERGATSAGHVNARNVNEVLSLFRALGYTYDGAASYLVSLGDGARRADEYLPHTESVYVFRRADDPNDRGSAWGVWGVDLYAAEIGGHIVPAFSVGFEKRRPQIPIRHVSKHVCPLLFCSLRVLCEAPLAHCPSQATPPELGRHTWVAIWASRRLPKPNESC